MSKKMMLSAGFVVLGSIVLASGCAAPPRWAQEEDTIRDHREKAVFGVGKASPELSGREEVRAAAARVRARVNMRKAAADYAGDFANRFIESNEEWFEQDELGAFLADFSEAFNVRTRLSGLITDEWVDSRGRLDGEGSAYALARLDLDADLFDVLKAAFAETLEKHGEEVLKVDAETVLAGLDTAAERAVAAPFEALVPAEPEPEPEVEEEQPEDGENDVDDAGNDEEEDN